MRIRDPLVFRAVGKSILQTSLAVIYFFGVLCTSHDNIGWALSDVHSNNRHRISMEEFLSSNFNERMEKTLQHTK